MTTLCSNVMVIVYSHVTDHISSNLLLLLIQIYFTDNRPFLSSLVPLFQNKSKCETFHMKMSSACSFILMQIKIVFIRMVLHLESR